VGLEKFGISWSYSGQGYRRVRWLSAPLPTFLSFVSPPFRFFSLCCCSLLWSLDGLIEAKSFQNAVRYSGDDPECWEGLGECYARLGKYIASLKAFSRSLDLNPSSSNALFHVALLKHKLSFFEEAIGKNFSAKIRTYRLFSWFFFSIDFFEKTLQLLPNDTPTRIKMAETYSSAGKESFEMGSYGKSSQQLNCALVCVLEAFESESGEKASRLQWSLRQISLPFIFCCSLSIFIFNWFYGSNLVPGNWLETPAVFCAISKPTVPIGNWQQWKKLWMWQSKWTLMQPWEQSRNLSPSSNRDRPSCWCSHWQALLLNVELPWRWKWRRGGGGRERRRGKGGRAGWGVGVGGETSLPPSSSAPWLRRPSPLPHGSAAWPSSSFALPSALNPSTGSSGIILGL